MGKHFVIHISYKAAALKKLPSNQLNLM